MKSTLREMRLSELTEEHGVLAARVAELRQQLTEAEHALRDNEIMTTSYTPVYTLPDDVLKQVLEETYMHKSDHRDLCCTTPHHDPCQ